MAGNAASEEDGDQGGLIELISKRQYRPLLDGLLALPDFTYVELAKRLGKSSNALTTQIARDDPWIKDLLAPVERTVARGPGRAPKVFKLRDVYRAAVEVALARIDEELYEERAANLPVLSELPDANDAMWLFNEVISNDQSGLLSRFLKIEQAEIRLDAAQNLLRSIREKGSHRIEVSLQKLVTQYVSHVRAQRQNLLNEVEGDLKDLRAVIRELAEVSSSPRDLEVSFLRNMEWNAFLTRIAVVLSWRKGCIREVIKRSILVSDASWPLFCDELATALRRTQQLGAHLDSLEKSPLAEKVAEVGSELYGTLSRYSDFSEFDCVKSALADFKKDKSEKHELDWAAVCVVDPTGPDTERPVEAELLEALGMDLERDAA